MIDFGHNIISFTVKMPLFFNKFAQRKTPMRKSGKLISEGTREDNNRSDTELTPIKFKLGEQEVQFNAGQWTSGFY